MSTVESNVETLQAKIIKGIRIEKYSNRTLDSYECHPCFRSDLANAGKCCFFRFILDPFIAGVLS